MESTSSQQKASSQGHSPSDEEQTLKLGLNPMNFDLDDDFDEDDDLEKEVHLEDDHDLLAYQRQKSTPKIIVQEFEGEDERSEAFKEQQAKQKKELFSHFYEHHLKSKYENARRLSLEEVAQHNSELDCWTVVDGCVYNIAPFISSHPGGKKILVAAGKDGTEIFSKLYSKFMLIEKHHSGIKLEETMLALLFEGFLEGSERDKDHQLSKITQLMGQSHI